LSGLLFATLLGQALSGLALVGPLLFGIRLVERRQKPLFPGEWVWLLCGTPSAFPWLLLGTRCGRVGDAFLLLVNPILLFMGITCSLISFYRCRQGNWKHWLGIAIIAGQSLATSLWLVAYVCGDLHG
jgi:hypothetical protein